MTTDKLPWWDGVPELILCPIVFGPTFFVQWILGWDMELLNTFGIPDAGFVPKTLAVVLTCAWVVAVLSAPLRHLAEPPPDGHLPIRWLRMAAGVNLAYYVILLIVPYIRYYV